MTAESLTIYYDGACPLCSREIEHYRSKDSAGRLRLVDIAAPGFDARAAGLDPVAVNKFLHVRLPDGALVTGLAAFTAIWDVLPGFGLLARAARLPLINPLLRGGYRAFAALRPYLPKRRAAECTGGSCPT